MFFAYLGMGIVGFACGCFAIWKFLMYHLMAEEKDEFLWRITFGMSGEKAQSLKEAFAEMVESARNKENDDEDEDEGEEDSD